MNLNHVIENKNHDLFINIKIFDQNFRLILNQLISLIFFSFKLVPKKLDILYTKIYQLIYTG